METLNHLEEVLNYLKEACEYETPITLKSLMNTLKSIDIFKDTHIFRYREEYLDIGYFDQYYGSIISFFPGGNSVEDFDDIAIYFIPYGEEKYYKDIKDEDQVLIVGIEANENKVCNGGKSFVALAQNKKYIDLRFKLCDYVNVEVFSEICKDRIEEYRSVNI